MTSLKALAVEVLTTPVVSAPFSLLMKGRATIFMAHRFDHPDRGVEGDDPAVLREHLSRLRRERYEFVGLEELFRRLSGDGRPLRRTVAFTIDDGYVDQAEIAAPVFAAFDCPVTTFVTTGFLDGLLWMWWDRIEYLFLRCPRQEVRAELSGGPVSYRWEDDAGRRRAQDDFVERCKHVSDADKHAAIVHLAAEVGVELPAKPPAEHMPMSWDQLRECEKRGMTFGPHTVTHPILSRVTDDASRRELEESWKRLRSEAARPVPIFCYPNGTWEDFGARETGALQTMGFLGAVVGVAGYADSDSFRRSPGERFQVRRFPQPPDPAYLMQYVAGIERLKQLLRREA
jgi:peptidoglycan/xylan/chitin deacetylase (PgdA/CDA1 family)